jgi:ankyrin repeat protein
MEIAKNDPLARATAQAIQNGDIETLKKLLDEHAGLAKSRITGGPDACESNAAARTLLHVATDWPGHFPNGGATVAMLVEAGADVNARFNGGHIETPLHWAASSDDIEALDALLDLGADIEAPGAVIGGGTPLADAVAFGQWRTAHRLIERGARANLWQAAALGLMDRVRPFFDGTAAPPAAEVTKAFWCACHGGQRESAAYLQERGADVNWVGFDDLTPLDAARRSGAEDVARWLEAREAQSTRKRT